MISVNGENCRTENFSSQGKMYKPNGLTSLPFNFYLNGDNGNKLKFFVDSGSSFPRFSNYKDLPTKINKSTGFYLTLNDLINTDSIIVALNFNLIGTFKGNFISLPPSKLESLSSSAYSRIDVYLYRTATVRNHYGGKEFLCTYTTNYSKVGLSIEG